MGKVNWGIIGLGNIANKFGDDVDFHIIGGTERDLNSWKDKIFNKNVSHN